MDNFSEILKDFDIVLRENNSEAYENLSNPSSSNEIEQIFAELNIDDSDLFDLFRWKGGVKNEGGCLMMRFGELLTLESIRESYFTNDIYDKFLIPLISDNGEEMLLFNSKKGKHYGKLYLYSVPELHIDYPISCYDSLAALMQTTIEAYKQKAYEYEQDSNWLKIDTYGLSEIAKKFNKESIYWTEYNPLKWRDWYEI